MADIVFVAIALGFFAVCVAYVRGLDGLVRSGDDSETVAELTLTESVEVAS